MSCRQLGSSSRAARVDLCDTGGSTFWVNIGDGSTDRLLLHCCAARLDNGRERTNNAVGRLVGDVCLSSLDAR